MIEESNLESYSFIETLKPFKLKYLFARNTENIENIHKKGELAKCKITNLYNYFSVESEIDLSEKQKNIIINALKKIPFIEFVESYYEFGIPQTTAVKKTAINLCETTNQLFLSDTIRGANIKLVDIERGWETSFPSEYSRKPVIGINSTIAAEKEHGTSVLGITSGNRNKSFTGIANMSNLFLVSESNERGRNIYAAVTIAIDITSGRISNLENGNVILTEIQLINGGGVFMPIEYSSTVNNLLQICACFNTIVIEPAANGGVLLDTLKNEAGKFMSSSNSRALIVGSSIYKCSTSRYLNKLTSSNSGKIVNSFVWGERIFTTKSTPAKYDYFENTSASSAIVAGLACYIQSAYKQKFGNDKFINPSQMKILLKNNFNSSYWMPNLAYLNTELLNIKNSRTINSICR